MSQAAHSASRQFIESESCAWLAIPAAGMTAMVVLLSLGLNTWIAGVIALSIDFSLLGYRRKMLEQYKVSDARESSDET